MKFLTIIAAIANVVFVGIIVTALQSQKPSKDFPRPPAIAQQWQITRVLDGDTVEATLNNETRRIRLCGIDAPEKDQPGGMESRKFLENLIRANTDKTAITFVERDRYGRWIGEIFVHMGNDIEKFANEELVANGYAWPYKQYWQNCPNKDAIAAAEAIATRTGKGLWLNSNNIPPWEYRRKK